MKQTQKAKIVHLGLIGLGTVGTGVARTLKTHAEDIRQKTGTRLVLKKVCVKHLEKKRKVALPKKLFTDRVNDILDDPQIDIVIEVMGGIHPAKEIIQKAYAKGKHVVTANKALLAEEGSFVFDQARRFGGKLGYEASVCGGIPIIKSLKEGLVSNRVDRFLGIVNGTCNYILTEMSRGPKSFKQALAEAQKLGFAEADQTLDVEGVCVVGLGSSI